MTIIDEKTMAALGPLLEAAVGFAIGAALTQALQIEADNKGAEKRRGTAR